MAPERIVVFAMVMLACYGFTPMREQANQPITKLSFSTATGPSINLQSTATSKATVFIFLSPECPLSQQCTAGVNKLFNAFAGANVNFYGVIPGSLYSQQEVTEFATAYHLGFPMLMDTANVLATLLNASVTPEVVMIDSTCQIAYSGAIDNSYIGLGKKNGAPTTAYLNDAISSVIHSTSPAIARTKPVGCFIEFKQVNNE